MHQVTSGHIFIVLLLSIFFYAYINEFFFFFLSRGSRTVGASYEIPPRRAILRMM